MSSTLEEAGWRGGPASSGFERGAVPAGRRMKSRRRCPASEGEEVGGELRAAGWRPPPRSRSNRGEEGGDILGAGGKCRWSGGG